MKDINNKHYYKIGNIINIKDNNKCKNKWRPHLILKVIKKHNIIQLQALTSQKEYKGKMTFILENIKLKNNRTSYTHSIYYKTLFLNELENNKIIHHTFSIKKAGCNNIELIKKTIQKIKLINSGYYNNIKILTKINSELKFTIENNGLGHLL